LPSRPLAILVAIEPAWFDVLPSTHRAGPAPLAFAVLAAGAACCALAAAQPPDPAGATFVIGAGAAVGPRYSGSAQTSVAPVLLLDYSTAGGFYASSMRGLGYGGQAGAFSYSAALGYRGERTQKDQSALLGNSGSSRLRGMGDIKGNASAVLGLAYAALPGISLGLSADLPMSRKDNGKNLHAMVSGELYSQGAQRVSLSLAAGFADSNYAQTYYGVSAAQAASSRFRAYRPGAGLYEVAVELSWEHRIDARWGITSMFAATRLVRDAGRSPVAERKSAPSAALYATYTY
jgi:outer membrane protein